MDEIEPSNIWRLLKLFQSHPNYIQEYHKWQSQRYILIQLTHFLVCSFLNKKNTVSRDFDRTRIHSRSSQLVKRETEIDEECWCKFHQTNQILITHWLFWIPHCPRFILSHQLTRPYVVQMQCASFRFPSGGKVLVDAETYRSSVSFNKTKTFANILPSGIFVRLG